MSVEELNLSASSFDFDNLGNLNKRAPGGL